jgi:DNA cross-link repair 1A protein
LLLGARRVAKAGEIVASKKIQGRGGWGGGTKTRDFYNSPAYKKITGTDFNVDGFMYARSSLTKNYWLTHFHSDHYGGITKDWNHGTIYCSLPTANLVNQQLGVDKKWLHPIPMNVPTVVESNGRPITVTLLDANHCPGAVMFLFEVGNRRILHVGDFRWNTETMLKQAPLRYLHNNKIRLDELYLDTTYCDERYSFPTQNEAIHACVKVAIQESTRPGKALFLFGAYTIG